MCFAELATAAIGAGGQIGASALAKKQPAPLAPVNTGDPNAGLAAIANSSGGTGGGDDLLQRLMMLSRGGSARSFGDPFQ